MRLQTEASTSRWETSTDSDAPLAELSLQLSTASILSSPINPWHNLCITKFHEKKKSTSKRTHFNGFITTVNCQRAHTFDSSTRNKNSPIFTI
jgi:hypothetical protein